MNRQQRRTMARQANRPGGDGVPLPALVAAAEDHQRLGRYAEAVDLYEQVLTRRPAMPEVKANLARAVYNLGNALYRQNDARAAIGCYGRAIELRPELGQAHGNLIRLLLAAGLPAEALAASVRSIALADSVELRRLFVQCARDVDPGGLLAEIRALLIRAFAEGWGRPVDLARAATRILLTDPLDTDSLARNPLMRAHLTAAPITDARLEQALTATRAESSGTAGLAFRCALAGQCFLNEYVFATDAAEAERVAVLTRIVGAALAADEAVAAPDLATLAAYGPLHAVPGAERLAGRAWPAEVQALIAQQVVEPGQERAIAAGLPCITPVTDPVSVAVRAQYEQNPYPRWTSHADVEANAVDAFLTAQFPAAYRPIGRNSLDMLVAGCGTGQHVITTARRFPDAAILAVDLSRASLAYAARKTPSAQSRQITYAQADILELGTLGRTFDAIEASGVLHHLSDPMAGWRVLLSLLKPGGVMRLGLYSASGRRHVAAAREWIERQGYPPSADGIRRCRQALLALPKDSLARQVTLSADFFTTSACRDLLFHVQEHRLSLPEIGRFIEEAGLTLLGFDVNARTRHRYKTRFPQDRRDSIAAWTEFEAEHPDSFTGMYQFWVQKHGP